MHCVSGKKVLQQLSQVNSGIVLVVVDVDVEVVVLVLVVDVLIATHLSPVKE